MNIGRKELCVAGKIVSKNKDVICGSKEYTFKELIEIMYDYNSKTESAFDNPLFAVIRFRVTHAGRFESPYYSLINYNEDRTYIIIVNSNSLAWDCIKQRKFRLPEYNDENYPHIRILSTHDCINRDFIVCEGCYIVSEGIAENIRREINENVGN